MYNIILQLPSNASTILTPRTADYYQDPLYFKCS